MATDAVGDPEVQKLYQYADSLSEAKDKSQHVSEYEGIISAVGTGSNKAKQLAAQLIPRFFKFFPNLSGRAVDAHFDLVEMDDIAVRVQAIRGLPLLCKDTPGNVSKIADVLGQLLISEENVERDAVHKALMSLLRQDVKASLSSLFGHILGPDENIREKVIVFLKDKVFPLKVEILKPQEQMERHVTDLVKKSLQDVTGAEFKMFMDFLSSLSIFGGTAPSERIQELIEIIEGQADLDAQFSVTDIDHIDRLISCLFMAIPHFKRGASSCKFLSYFNKHILPVFDKLPEERKPDLLRTLAGTSPYATAQYSRQLLPSIVQLLKKHMLRRKTGEEINFTYVECLLYTFHNLSHKTPNSTNSLCGYKIVTGQPSDRLGEDFSEIYIDFVERLKYSEELVKGTMKRLTQGLTEYNKKLTAATTEEAKADVKKDRQNATTAMRICNNILAMTKPLHSKTPSFIGDDKINLSWKELPKPSANPKPATAGFKRDTNPSISHPSNSGQRKRRRGQGSMQSQLISRAFEDASRDGGSSGGRGRSGRRGRGWGGRGRGHGYY